MKTLCYSVRLESLVSISDLAFKARSFNGAEDVMPKSQVFGPDLTVSKSEAWWISAWILEKKSIQYSKKKSTYHCLKTKNSPNHGNDQTPINRVAEAQQTLRKN